MEQLDKDERYFVRQEGAEQGERQNFKDSSTTSDVVQHWYGALEQEAGNQAGSGRYEDEQVDARPVKERQSEK